MVSCAMAFDVRLRKQNVMMGICVIFLVSFTLSLLETAKSIHFHKTDSEKEKFLIINNWKLQALDRTIIKHLLLTQGCPWEPDAAAVAQYRDCAVVGNGGILLNSSCGQEIDQADLVIRFNLPPMNFSEDVGTKTSLVTINPSIIETKFQYLLARRKPFADALYSYRDAFFLLPTFSFVGHSTLGYRALYTMEDFGLVQKALFLNPEYLRNLGNFWRKKGLQAYRLSSGFMLVSMALEFCERITLYGFWPFSHDLDNQIIPHHYYDNMKPKPGQIQLLVLRCINTSLAARACFWKRLPVKRWKQHLSKSRDGILACWTHDHRYYDCRYLQFHWKAGIWQWKYALSRQDKIKLIHLLLTQRYPWEPNATEVAQYRAELRQCCNASFQLVLTKENTPLGSNITCLEDNDKVAVEAEFIKLLPETSPFSQSQYKNCAVVGNGGTLRNSSCGHEIDQADLVVRFNLPPMNFSEDVGTKTDLMTINPSILKNRFHHLLAENKSFADALGLYRDALFIIPIFTHSHDNDVGYRAIHTMKGFGLAQKAFFLNPQYRTNLKNYWMKKNLQPGRFSSGFVFLSIALEFCQRITLYGFWPFLRDLDNQPIPHHYFDDSLPDVTVHDMPTEFSLYLHMYVQNVLLLRYGKCQ
ncbi:hypothetical protein JD844_001138 [Phrynosoma platyrhinos]|uniref:Uncharacterized protein n=1 Tax=Phrynosoma platyrhinos TaxID=52577 RepID=A0ABQ7TA07_PHRPL|nr:hypothetical protein JD844_001138 [Phrynosoma platyrhinos]